MLQFRLTHLIYVVTLVSASLATFGIRGAVPAIVLPIFWAVVYASKSRPRAFCVYGLPLVFVSGCAGLWTMVAEPRENSRRFQCSANLYLIALALHKYHDVYKAFPPAYVADASGKPAHSWRVLILPFLGQEPLYKRYAFDEPWDGPTNRALLTSSPIFYQCPSRQAKDVMNYLRSLSKRMTIGYTDWVSQKAWDAGDSDFVDLSCMAPVEESMGFLRQGGWSFEMLTRKRIATDFLEWMKGM